MVAVFTKLFGDHPKIEGASVLAMVTSPSEMCVQAATSD